MTPDIGVWEPTACLRGGPQKSVYSTHKKLSRTVVRDWESLGTQLFKQASFCGQAQTETHNFETLCCHEQTSVDFKPYCY